MKDSISTRLKAGIFFTMAMLAIACGDAGEKKQAGKPYFDVEEYFNRQVLLLTKAHAYFRKSLDSNGKTDEIKNTFPDWKHELQLFYEADINKAATIGRMQVDTLRDKSDSTHQKFTLVYTPNDKSIKIKDLKISFGKEHEVREIYAHIESISAMDSIATDLHYIPGKYYEINSRERTTLVGSSYYTVKGNILTEDKYFQ